MTRANDARNWKLYAGRPRHFARPSEQRRIAYNPKALAARGLVLSRNSTGATTWAKSGCGVLRKSARKADATPAYNLAITYRNRGDMLGYRIALHHFAWLGTPMWGTNFDAPKPASRKT